MDEDKSLVSIFVGRDTIDQLSEDNLEDFQRVPEIWNITHSQSCRCQSREICPVVCGLYQGMRGLTVCNPLDIDAGELPARGRLVVQN
jgi:hypothetical protein